MSRKITPESLYETMQELVALGSRICGSAAERAAADYIARSFRDAGLVDVGYESFPVRSYEARAPRLAVSCTGKTYTLPAHPIWYTKGGKVRGQAVSVGLGAPPDFDRAELGGKICVVESRILLNYYPTHSLFGTYRQAAAKGATAYIACIDAPLDLAPRYNHLHEDEPPGPIPGLLLSRADGALLRGLLESHPEGVEVELELISRESTETTGDVVGYLPGSDDILIVGSHYDSVYAGAVDNAGANAGLMALAHFTAGLEGRRPTVVFAAHPGHEVNIGAREFVKRHEDIIRRAYLYLSIDGFGSTGWSWGPYGVLPTGTDEKRGISVSDNPLLLKIAVEAVKEFGLLPAAYVGASDIIFNRDLEGRFYGMGVPTLMIIGKPIWYHTIHDTPDKVTPDQLFRSFRAHAEILTRLLSASPDEVRKNDRKERAEVMSGILPEETREAGPTRGRSVTFGMLPAPARRGEPALCFISDFTNPDEVIADVQWDFGDGTGSHGPVAAHVYEKEGRYRVSVSGVDTAGLATTVSQGLWVVG